MTTFDVDGVRVFYEECGSGDPLLLIHGAAASGLWYSDVIPLLAEHYRVIVPDLRGLGRSERVAPLTEPQIWVSDILRVLDAASADYVHVVGASLGSRIGGRIALEHRDRVRTLTVDGPIIGLNAHGNAALSSAFAPVEEDSEQGREWRYLHGPDWREVVEFYAKTRVGPKFQPYYTLRPQLREIDVPTLICRGDFDDSVHPIDDAIVWHSEAPSTRLWIVPGLSQSSVIKERPAEFVETLRTFHATTATRADDGRRVIVGDA